MFGGIVLQNSTLLCSPQGSTAFQPEDDPELPLNWKGCTPRIARSFNTLPKESLTWMVTRMPDCSIQACGSTGPSMISHITGIPCEHWATSHPWIGKQVAVV